MLRSNVWKYGNPLRNVGTGVKTPAGARFIPFEGDVRVIRVSTRETIAARSDTEQVNDLHGHLVDSHVLMEMAGVILGSVRDTDALDATVVTSSLSFCQTQAWTWQALSRNASAKKSYNTPSQVANV